MDQTGIEPNALYHAYSPEHDRDHARRAFVSRYGSEPKQMIVWKGLLYVGPVAQVQVVGDAQLTADAHGL